MNGLITVMILFAAFVAAFIEASFDGFRNMFGAQFDLLAALVVYTSLTVNLWAVGLLAVCGGLWLDALSANPLGSSVLPMFVVGLLLYQKRELILREQAVAQMIIGALASVVIPALTLLLLLTVLPLRGPDYTADLAWNLAPPLEFGNGPADIPAVIPLAGWATLFQATVLAVSGAVFTPVIFRLMDGFRQALSYPQVPETSFRPDREMKRGRNL